jgi:hypothetical protein
MSKAARPTAAKGKLVLTIDVEWFYNGDASGSLSGFSNMPLEERFRYDGGQIRTSVGRILDILDRTQQHITFFTVAELDAVYPEVLQDIYDRGHEIGLHSFRHEDLSEIEDFDAELLRCYPFRVKYDVVSFRAPSIRTEARYYSALKRHGYRFDSSVYGTKPFEHSGIGIYPVSVLPWARKELNSIPCAMNGELLKKGIPFGSGLFVGVLHPCLAWFVSRFSACHHHAPCLFIHSWQVCQPHYPFKAKVRNPWMLGYSIELGDAFESLCGRYQLVRLRDCFSQAAPQPASIAATTQLPSA